jgi:transcriptional adapter 2-alpha
MQKPTPPVETPSAAQALVAPELPRSAYTNGNFTPADLNHSSHSPEPDTKDKSLTNGHTNGTTNGTSNGTNGHTNGTLAHRPRLAIPPLAGNAKPFDLNNSTAADFHLLSADEKQLCNVLRIMPGPYLVIKENLIKEAQRQGGSLKKKGAKEICKVCLERY